jgi:glycogen(starch) synthase
MVDEVIKANADSLFEVSFEVCNKVGGIYTVVKSKATKMLDYYGQNYFLIGPYFAQKALGEFSEEVPKDFCRGPFEELKKEGIICHYGRWNIEGNPNVILVDFEGFKHKINDIKKEFWENYQIDSLRAANDYDEPVTWSYAAGKLIEKLSNVLQNKKIVVHFHEWLSGAGLLYLKKNKVKVGTVFTTHATVLGRTLASSNIDLYNVWDKIDTDKEVYKYSVESKHQIEKQSAINTNIFSTVSEITSMEAEHLLGRKADIILVNGLDIEKFPTFEEIAIKHRIQRSKIREFLLYYFFPHYTFDIKETLFYFIAGRYEFRDKGIDIFIKALGKLNKKMKAKQEKTIIVFIWVPANIRNIKPELLENRTHYQDIKDALEDVKDDMNKNILYNIISNKKILKNSLFDKNFLLEMKRKTNRFKKKGNPPLSTHDFYEDNDAIIKALKESNLNNNKDDPVKVIYYPIYLSGADGLLNLNYYEAMEGSHLGIFPSYYEPWGYTPLEAGALGVSSVTTDLAGFGRFFCNEYKQEKNPGIFVLKRFEKSDEDVINQLVKVMFDFSNLSKHDRIANKMQARKIASTADWKIFVKNYIKAHNMALEKIKM